MKRKQPHIFIPPKFYLSFLFLLSIPTSFLCDLNSTLSFFPYLFHLLFLTSQFFLLLLIKNPLFLFSLSSRNSSSSYTVYSPFLSSLPFSLLLSTLSYKIFIFSLSLSLSIHMLYLLNPSFFIPCSPLVSLSLAHYY